ncbi:YcnI family protein [Micromonospora sp. NBC_01699]|uniref:YcnI family copper-binding membrane protein n=1 Tax=Micromonospora sp. NBC_01699 TaxID=2975984 RepID=UPI002E2A714F|nr:YcnI family protein [Micromonospora sp. NBC_01699]
MPGSVRAGRTPAVRIALLGVALAGGLWFATPASADVTVTPAQAYRGDAAKLTFRVPDERAGAYTSRVELRLPESAPVAEVYPMSVPDWGPTTTTRPVTQPLGGIHHGNVTEVTSAIIWTRTAPPASPGVAELVVALGPMPEAEQLVFDVTQTYSDGTQVRWSTPPGSATGAGTGPAPVVALLAPAAPPPPPPATDSDGTNEVAAGDDVATDRFSDVLRVGLLIVLLATAALGGAAVARRRHPATSPAAPTTPTPDATPEPPTDPEPTPTRWRLRP